MKTYKKIISVLLSTIMVLMYMNCSVIPAEYANATSKMMLYFNLMEASAGQDVQLNLYATNAVAIKEIENLRLIIPDGFEVTGMEETSPVFNGNVTYSVTDNYLNFNISSNGTLNTDSNIAATIYMHISENCTAGKYDFQWSTNYLLCTKADGTNYTPTLSFGRIVVGNSTTVTTTTSTTVTTTTTMTTTVTTTTTSIPEYNKYSVRFVDEETGKLVSGIKYNIVSYDYANDIAYPIQTSSDNPDCFEFMSDTAYVELSTVVQAIPDEYYIKNGTTRWELSANTPDLTVYLSKTLSTTITTTTTTSTTTVSAYHEITIDSLPTKTAYNIGEELDLTGGEFHSHGREENGSYFTSVRNSMTDNNNVDISEFDNSKAGTYKIYIRMNYDNILAETYFEVTVSELLNLGDINNDGIIDSVDASMILTEYSNISTSGKGNFTTEQKQNSDINSDGIIDSVDASILLSYYAYISTGGTNSILDWIITNNI